MYPAGIAVAAAMRGSSIPPRLWPRTKIRPGFDPLLLRGELDRQHRIVDDLFVQGIVVQLCDPGSVRPCALVVPERCDAGALEIAGDIAERPVRPERFVAVLRPGAVDQNHQRKRVRSRRPERSASP